MIETYIVIVLTGICNGIGTSIGIYLANRGLLKHMDKVGINGFKQSK